MLGWDVPQKEEKRPQKEEKRPQKEEERPQKEEKRPQKEEKRPQKEEERPHRKVYSIPSSIVSEQALGWPCSAGEMGDKKVLLSYVRDNEIGRDKPFLSPFGTRNLVYCDYTASGRGLAFLETYISNEVLPWYANTHSMVSTCATQTSMFREEARQLVRYAVNAHNDNDSVIFTGSGTTGALSLLQHIIGSERVVALVGEDSHHSLYTPWVDRGEVIVIGEESRMEELEVVLKEIRAVDSGVKIIGCFSAASNVTGHLYNTDHLAIMLHKYNALCVVDYATAAPYVTIDMNPVEPGTYKDAIVFSPHKFIGGVESPGVLVAKKHMFCANTPSISGGGTVFFVRENEVKYLQSEELREEGGTPNIVGTVRAGLAIQLKLAISVDVIKKRNAEILDQVERGWSGLDNLIILGDLENRLPIFSFLISFSSSSSLFLHHNYVVSLLNDVFGIQCRGGCLCAGPLVQRLLGISPRLTARYLALLSEDPGLDRHHLRRKLEYSQHEVFRPGVTRLSISYTASDDEVRFIVAAVKMIAKGGWKLLPLYRCDPETGEWLHQSNLQFAERRWLGHINYSSNSMNYKKFPREAGPGFEECLKCAEKLFSSPPTGQHGTVDVFADSEDLRWFLLPSEAAQLLAGNTPPTVVAPFHPSAGFDRSGVRMERSRMVEEVVRRLKIMEDSPPAPKPTPPSLLSWLIDHCSRVLSTFLQNLSWITSAKNKPLTNTSEERPIPLTNTSEERPIPLSINKPINPITEETKIIIETESNPKVEGCVVRTPKAVKSIKWFSPPRCIFKPLISAIEEFNMIENGDRVLLCLSGGKDSLSLLHCLRQYQFVAKSKGINFDLGAVTVDPMTPAYNPAPLIPYLAELGVPYFFERQPILAQAESVDEVRSICSFCSRMKRGRIYAAARREDYNVIAMGQHLDDLVESFFMSVFHNGLLRTMKANYFVQEGDLRVIRPLINVRERDLRSFANSVGLPVIPENCPACFEAPKERHRIKQLLAQQELIFPRLFQSLQCSIRPLFAKNRTGMESDRVFSKQNGAPNPLTEECTMSDSD